jgi:hypothetical protein
MPKVKAECWLVAPAQRIKCLGWSANPGSRWGVVRLRGDAKQPWVMRHLRSGQAIGSLLPPRKVSLAEQLAVCAALDACSEDFACFDALPLVGPDYNGPAPQFASGDVPVGMVGRMMDVAREALV